MTAAEFVKLANEAKSPAARFEAVRLGIEGGYINKRQALALLDFKDLDRPAHLRLVPPPVDE